MVIKVGALVGKTSAAARYVRSMEQNLRDAQARARRRTRSPRVFFEEWYDPLISGICWVSELVELCGGKDIYLENRSYPDAKRRIIADNADVIARKPDILIASWCGKGFKPEKVLAREGWNAVPAVKNNQLYEIHSSVILQPGPAALTDGVRAIEQIYDKWEQTTR